MAFVSLSNREQSVLRDLAKRVAEIAALPHQAEKAALWQRHNRLERVAPRVLVMPEGSWREVIRQEDLLVEDPEFQRYEWYLRSRIFYHEHIKDDNVILNVLRVSMQLHSTGYGSEEDTTRPEDPTGTSGFQPVIRAEEDFFEKVRMPEVTVDWEETNRQYDRACELFDGILRVEKFNLSGYWHYDLVDLFARWRGIQQFLVDLIDRPKWVHRCLQFLTDGRLRVLESLEKQNALTLNNTADYLSSKEYGFMSGGVCYTNELPQPDFDGTNVRTMDMWGHATTQVFSRTSPAMHEEFALRYEIQFLSRFGVNGYGCCEPLHNKIAEIKKIPRLRRISISPWADAAKAAEQMGDRYILSSKPNPAGCCNPDRFVVCCRSRAALAEAAW